ncbi:MAG: 3'(2'),5'-bisphosphate nucleotidase CysQ [Gemmatimonadales bacterium]|nr:3'(2'),5'-bisphosphate nucleotidase CysQ [Gemmatimonadota bacterium]MBP6670412.1 3'(2'),5'-bisphosphate nucleotidase CysQ [Gemmatimonadales bacterium]
MVGAVEQATDGGVVTVSPDALVRLCALAVEAGRATLVHYHAGVKVEQKGDKGPVTAADHAAHAVIAAGLAAWDPGMPVISEEAELPGYEARRAWPRFWLVDPLDGTKEFIQRNGEFTVNIALIDGGVPVLGVIYAPALDLLYYAGHGLGSWKREGGGPPVRITSRPPLPQHALRVAESRSHPSKELEAYLQTIQVAERVPAGSSLKFCWVAEGKADIYPRLGPTMEWDVAAGDCIFRNSGEGRPRRSALVYNQPELKNQGFVIGLADSELETGSGAGRVIWFTGLSGSGKSTIARRVVEALEARGAAVEYLDGDAIRDIFPATGFTRPERDAHIRRVGWVASRLERHGVTVIASLVSPYEESRRFVRGLAGRFVEVWVSTPFDECARRDIKGLYARALRGEIKHFTGLDDPYEPPSAPELSMDTTHLTVDEAVARVLRYLEEHDA